MIYLHMAGAPSQFDLLDYKPKLFELSGRECPESLLKKERFAFIKGVATMLHGLGLDQIKRTYKIQGREFRLTDVAGEVMHPLLA